VLGCVGEEGGASELSAGGVMRVSVARNSMLVVQAGACGRSTLVCVSIEGVRGERAQGDRATVVCCCTPAMLC